MKGLKEFLTRGNAVDLAVGVVVGAAFSKIVDALVGKFLDPLIAALFGKPNFDAVGQFTINDTVIQPGAIITAIIQFLIVAIALYFLVVLPMNKLSQLKLPFRASGQKEEEKKEEVSREVELLSDIRTLLKQQQPRS